MAVLGDMSTVSLFNVLGLFKSEEQKKKEYEDNIATNVAAMEVQNRANEGTAYSNDPRFQRPSGPAAVDPLRGKKYGPNTMVYKNNGQYFIADGSVDKLTGRPFKEINYQEQSKELKDKIDIDLAENNNRIRFKNQVGDADAPSLMSMGYIEREPTTAIEIAGQPFSPAQQESLRVAELTDPAGNISLSALQRGVGFNAASQPQTTEALNTATGGMDYMNLLKILSMVQGGGLKTSTTSTPKITPGITPAVAGTKIQDEDLYARYRR